MTIRQLAPVRAIVIVICLSAFAALVPVHTKARVAGSPLGPIAFVSDFGNHADIWVLDPNSGEARNVTADSYEDFEPALSPDAEKVAYGSFRRGVYEIWVAGIRGAKQFRLSISGDAWHPSWSPDGRSIVFATPNALCVYDLENAQSRVLVRGAFDEPSWMPANQTIIAVGYLKGDDGSVPTIQLIDATTGRTTVARESRDGRFRSPSGKSPEEFAYAFNNTGRWMIARESGAEISTPFARYKDSTVHPAYSRCGRYMAFAIETGTGSSVWLARSDGTVISPLAEALGTCYDPSW